MREKETSRVEAFSDGVFAIAITLLVFNIKVPYLPPGASNHALLEALLAAWPSLLAFVISFATLLILWVNHHELFTLIQGVDARLLFANGFLLFLITFVPFPTAVLAEYLNREAANTAAALYCGTYVVLSVAYNLLERTAAHQRLVKAQASEAQLHTIRTAYRVGLLVYLVATALAFVNAFVGLAVCVSLWGVWACLHYRPADKPTGASRRTGEG